MIYWVLGIIAYLVIGYFVYEKSMSKNDLPKWQQIVLSFIGWPLLIPLWVIHKLHMLCG